MRIPRLSHLWRSIRAEKVTSQQRLTRLMKQCLAYVRDRLQSITLVDCVPFQVEEPPRTSSYLQETVWSRDQLHFLDIFENLLVQSSSTFRSLQVTGSYGINCLCSRIAWLLTRYASNSLKEVCWLFREDFITEDWFLWMLTTCPKIETFISESSFSKDALTYIAKGWHQSLIRLHLQLQDDPAQSDVLLTILKQCRQLRHLTLTSTAGIDDVTLRRWVHEEQLSVPALNELNLRITSYGWTAVEFKMLRLIFPNLLRVTFHLDFSIFHPDQDFTNLGVYLSYLNVEVASFQSVFRDLAGKQDWYQVHIPPDLNDDFLFLL